VSGDLQLGLFPALRIPAAGRERGRRGGRVRGEPAAPDPSPAALPRRIPASGIEVSADVGGLHVRLRLRRSRRAWRVRILVERSGLVTVVLPERVPIADVPGALAEHADWIVRTVERCRRRPGRAPELADGRPLVVGGVPHVVRILTRPLGAPARVTRIGGEIRVELPPLAGRGARALVREWLIATARAEIPEHVRRIAGELGIPAGRVAVRDQRTKWGSCSGTGSLSFNWRLLLAPPEVLDYVVVHELCHVRELNHSARFWRHVRAARPEYEGPRAWLAEHAESLDL
jgi:predicted metal-dependent hydrolase